MIPRAVFVLTAVLFMACSAASLRAEIVFFAPDKVSRDYHGALLRAPAIDVLYQYSTESLRHYMVFDFGAKIPAISMRTDSLSFDIGGAGGVFTRFELFSESFNFVHADFTGMLFSDVRYKNVLFQTAVYHTSSHLGDDYIRYDHGRIRNTGWEAARQYVSYVSDLVIVSAGAEYKFSRRPGATVFYPLSFFLGCRLDFTEKGAPFFMELEVEAIAGRYAPNFGVRMGIYLKYLFNTVGLGRKPDGNEPHEIAVYYYNGYSRMGCFYRRRESLVLFGPTFRY